MIDKHHWGAQCRFATSTITAYVLSFLAALLALLYLLLFLFEPVASVDAVHLGIARCQLPRWVAINGLFLHPKSRNEGADVCDWLYHLLPQNRSICRSIDLLRNGQHYRVSHYPYPHKFGSLFHWYSLFQNLLKLESVRCTHETHLVIKIMG